MLDIRLATVDELAAADPALFRAHWAEVGETGDVDVDWQQHRTLEAAGLLRSVAAYDGAALGGYVVVIRAPRQLHTARGAALLSAFFVSPTHRHHGTARRLLQAAEAEGEGMDTIEGHAVRGSAMERLLTMAGYRERFVTFRKEAP